MKPPLRITLLLVATLANLAACSGKDPYNPGTPLGTFHVQGKLTSTTCGGDANAAPDPWVFDIKLSRDHSTLYWIQGGPPVSGQLDPQSHATLRTSDTRTLHEADARRGLAFCGLTRDDTLDATLGPEPIQGFTGTLVYAFTPSDGSDCSDQLTTAGGTFAALPCSIHYDLTATLAPPTKY